MPAETTISRDIIPAGFNWTWPIDTEPHEVARLLKSTFDFGRYKSDDPHPYIDEAMQAKRTPTRWPSAVQQRVPTFKYAVYPDWWNIKSTTGDVLGALDTLEFEYFSDEHIGALRHYARMLADGDPEMARPMAEVYVRACTDKQLPAALELLAAVYHRCGDEAALDRMVDERSGGLNYKPAASAWPVEYRELEAFKDVRLSLADQNDPAKLLRNAGSSLLRGDLRAATKWLDTVDRLVLDKQQRQAAERVFGRLSRLRDGLSASLRDDAPSLATVESAFARIAVKREIAKAGVPLAQRLDALTVPEVLAELNHELAVFGTQGYSACDRLLYLIEQRQWSGLEFEAKTIYDCAFHINKFYDPARAIAPYVLTQKVGCLRPLKGNFREAYFSAAECGIYLQRCFEDHEKLLARPDAWSMIRPVIVLSAAMCNDPTAPTTGHDYAWVHRDMANDSIFEFDSMYGHLEASGPLLARKLQEMPPGFQRHFVREKWLFYLYRNAKNLDAALEQIELMCQGVDHIGAREEGVRYLQWWAKEHDRADLWDKSIQYARQAQETAREEVDNAGYRDHLIKMHQALIDKPRTGEAPFIIQSTDGVIAIGH